MINSGFSGSYIQQFHHRPPGAQDLNYKNEQNLRFPHAGPRSLELLRGARVAKRPILGVGENLKKYTSRQKCRTSSEPCEVFEIHLSSSQGACNTLKSQDVYFSAQRAASHDPEPCSMEYYRKWTERTVTTCEGSLRSRELCKIGTSAQPKLPSAANNTTKIRRRHLPETC